MDDLLNQIKELERRVKHLEEALKDADLFHVGEEYDEEKEREESCW